MDYCGIDLAGVSSYVYVTDSRGRKLTAGEVATDRVAFERRLKRFTPGGLSVAIEAGSAHKRQSRQSGRSDLLPQPVTPRHHFAATAKPVATAR